LAHRALYHSVQDNRTDANNKTIDKLLTDLYFWIHHLTECFQLSIIT